MPNQNLFYTVRKGDTLSKIAKSSGTSVAELKKINSIKDINQIQVGQKIALSRDANCKAAIQLLDRDRNPIKDAKLRLEFCGKQTHLTSASNGRLPDIVTDTPEDIIKIFISRADGTWKEITKLTSGWGNKLVTLVSPKIKIESETKPHPKDKLGNPKQDDLSGTRSVGTPTSPKSSTAQGKTQSTFGNDKGIKVQPQQNQSGLPTAKVTNDQAEFDFLDDFNGELLTDNDFKWAANELDIEEAVVRAINEVEASGKGFVQLNGKNVPKILYERHYFSKLTGGKYSLENPDISWPVGYYQKSVKYVPVTFTLTAKDGSTKNVDSWRRYRGPVKDKALIKKVKTGQELLDAKSISSETDLYTLVKNSYKRLAKAYALDKEAALRSCSWGGFQIMGDHYKKMGYDSAATFVKAMSRSEREQIRALVLFFKYVDPTLVQAMKKKNFVALAAGFNGPAYKDNKYDEKLLTSYKKWKKI